MKLSKAFASLLIAVSTLAPVAADPPQWWDGVIDVTAQENPQGPVNQGQLKNMATHLYQELVTHVGTPNFQLTDLFPAPPASPDLAWYEDQKKIVNLGQLKAVATPFYDYLNGISPQWVRGQIEANHGNGISWTENYPWDPTTPLAENLKPANIGQLKLVFSLRILLDDDQDGVPTITEILLGTGTGSGSDSDSDSDSDPSSGGDSYVGPLYSLTFTDERVDSADLFPPFVLPVSHDVHTGDSAPTFSMDHQHAVNFKLEIKDIGNSLFLANGGKLSFGFFGEFSAQFQG